MQRQEKTRFNGGILADQVCQELLILDGDGKDAPDDWIDRDDRRETKPDSLSDCCHTSVVC
jgi:hypothetical protein